MLKNIIDTTISATTIVQVILSSCFFFSLNFIYYYHISK